MIDPYEELLTGKSHPLIEACKAGDLILVKDLLTDCRKNDTAINVCDRGGWQAVHYAAELEDTSILRALLDEDEYLVESRTFENATPLVVAAGLGNVSAVKVLLSLIDDSQIMFRTIHGHSALYYAIKCEQQLQGSEIACLLIDRYRNASFIGEYSDHDAVPFKVIKEKNAVVFKSLLKAGLDLAYHVPLSTTFNDDDFDGFKPKPYNLAAYCVTCQWSDGLQLMIDEYYSRKGNAGKGTRRLHEIFVDYGTNIVKLYSAWHLTLVLGEKSCLEIMLNAGMRLNECWIEHSNILFPYSIALSGDIWQKRQFIHFVTGRVTNFQDCYNTQYYVHKDNDNVYKNPPHPLMTASEAIVKAFASKHSVWESINMLSKCGFSFDFTDIPYMNSSGDVEWHCSTSLIFRIICSNEELISDRCLYISIAVNLLNDELNLPITPLSVFWSIKATGSEEIHPTDSPYMSALKALSCRSADQIESVMKTLEVSGNNIYYIHGRNMGREARTLQLPTTRLVSIQLLVKGFRATNRYTVSHENRPHLVAFSDLLLNDADKRADLQSLKSKGLLLSLEKYKFERVASLMELTRRTIRTSVGVGRLVKEPVPRKITTDYSTNVSIDKTWEFSSIDQLHDLPLTLKDYLRYKPEIDDFLHYTRERGRERERE